MTTPAEHVKPEAAPEICWLLDVRRHGIEAANHLHANDAL